MKPDSTLYKLRRPDPSGPATVERQSTLRTRERPWGDHPVDPRLDLANHSPTGMNFGYGGSGPAQAALAILADFTEDDGLALELYQRFKRTHLEDCPGDALNLRGEDIRTWIESVRGKPDPVAEIRCANPRCAPTEEECALGTLSGQTSAFVEALAHYCSHASHYHHRATGVLGVLAHAAVTLEATKLHDPVLWEALCGDYRPDWLPDPELLEKLADAGTLYGAAEDGEEPS